MDTYETKEPAEQKQEELMKEWQERLGLQEWRIRLCTGLLPEDLSLRDADGCTEYSEPIKTARIDILGEAYYGNHIVPFDFERILVHELLHLKFSLLDESGNDLQDRVVHQLIDDLARALVCAKRHTIRIGLKNEQL